MTGVIRYQSSEVLGTIEKNTTSGIFGRITKDQGIFQQGELVETAYKQDVTTGPAVLLSAVGGSVRAYSIQIEKVNLAGSDPNKSMVISVTDPELLNRHRRYHPGHVRQPHTPERKTHRRRHPRLRPGFRREGTGFLLRICSVSNPDEKGRQVLVAIFAVSYYNIYSF